jgi:DNA primase
MKGHIPNDFINQIISGTDIVEIISRFISLKKRGNSHIACCPFHNEKTPSFHVSQSKQIYHCFGCGVGGNVITFLKDYENFSFVEAVEELAQIQNISIPYENANHPEKSSTKYKENGVLINCLTDVQKYYTWSLKMHTDGKQAITYLKGRSISGATAKQFKIGYAPNEWEAISNNFRQKYGNEVLTSSGLVIQKNQKNYDRFRNRIMFPIRNRKGHTIGFGGRVFNNETNQPKYLNSPETEIFHKGQELYGLYETKQAIKRPDEILVVEGYLDVISLYEHGYQTAVATLGTALTEHHLKILFRECSTLIFCFDGDAAGWQASIRTVKLALSILNETKTAKFLILPEKDDPDTIIQKEGLEAFRQRIIHAVSISDFIILYLSKEYNLATADGQSKAIIQLQDLLSAAPEVIRQVTINAFTNASSLSSSQINRLFKSKSNTKTLISNLTYYANIDLAKLPVIHKIIKCLFLNPCLADEINTGVFEKYNSKNIEILLDVVSSAKKNENTAIIIQELSDKYPEQKNLFYSLASSKFELDNDEEIKTELIANMKSLENFYQQKKLDYLVEKSKLYSLSSEEKEELLHLLHKTGN